MLPTPSSGARKRNVRNFKYQRLERDTSMLYGCKSMRILVAGTQHNGTNRVAQMLCAQHQAPWLRAEKLVTTGFTWAEIASVAQVWLKRHGPWIVSGSSVPRIIRRWYRENPGHILPCEQVWWTGVHDQSAGCKAVQTVWNECLPKLLSDRKIELFGPDCKPLRAPRLIG